MKAWWGHEFPKGWLYTGEWGNGYAFQDRGLRVLVDCAEKEDGNMWVHVSYSREKWAPSHDDTMRVRGAFIGDRFAYAVFPTKDRYVNIHPFCLHLWARLDGTAVLPHFDDVLEGVGRSI